MRNFTIGLSIGIALIIFGFFCFMVGLSHAPQRIPDDEMDHIQILCDNARKEPWKAEIVTSCEYMQQFFAIDYKCDEKRGCYAEARNGDNQ